MFKEVFTNTGFEIKANITKILALKFSIKNILICYVTQITYNKHVKFHKLQEIYMNFRELSFVYFF